MCFRLLFFGNASNGIVRIPYDLIVLIIISYDLIVLFVRILYDLDRLNRPVSP